MKRNRLALTFAASVLAHFGFVLFTHASVAFWAVFGTLAGLSLMVGTGASVYRYLLMKSGPDMGIAILAAFFFPIALPIALTCWAAVWPERKHASALAAARRRAALEAEAFRPLEELP